VASSSRAARRRRYPPERAVVSEVSDVPLTPMLAHPLRVIREDDRERYLKKAGAWLAVAVVHVLFIAAILTAIDVRELAHAPREMFFILPPLQGHVETIPPVRVTPSVRLTPVPQRLNVITLPPPKPQAPPQSQNDVMQAIGKELACGAGPWEHLTQSQREACRRQPWRFKKNAHGTIVMDTSVPPPDEPTTTSGADQELHIQQTADPCLAAGNTHSECIHKTLFGR
jgi:hypothetical protein